MASRDCMEWLRFAKMDIDLAELTYRQQNPRHRNIEGILYHCQQGVEKALKAYIVQNGLLPPRTHDLHLLRTQCTSWNTQFNNTRIVGHCTYLNSYSVVVRYPYHNMSLDSNSASRGLNSAKRVYDFVLKQLGLKPVYYS